MRRNSIKCVAVLAMLGVLTGCSVVSDYYDQWFGDAPKTKPAELVTFKPTATAKILWSGNVGSADQFVFTPTLVARTVYATGASGQITRFDASSGKALGRIDTKARLAGGVGSDGQIVVAGTGRGELFAFDQDGKALWKGQLSSEILAAPQIVQGIVVVRTGDGRIYGLDPVNGSRKWVYQRSLPPLTVRTYAGVVIYRGAIFAGFPGGRLVALGLVNGSAGWDATVALPKGSTELERVADISSLPVLDDNQICAVAYQGRVACFNPQTGAQLWARDISSVAGLAMDNRNVYVSDDKSAVVAFDKSAGASGWKQDKLAGRNITAPAVIGKYVAVGDFQGYVHFLSIDDGSFVARIETDGSAIIAPPLVMDNALLVQTTRGGVFAIGIQ